VSRGQTLGLGAALVAGVAFPIVVEVNYFIHLTIIALIWVIVTQGTNVIQGYTGYVTIAQGGFMGIGAYTSALLSAKEGWPVWIAMGAAPLMTAVLALLAGYPSLRVKGHYFAIVTLAYNMVIFIVLLNWIGLTGGEAGIPRIPRPEAIPLPWGDALQFETRRQYYYLAFAATLVASVAAYLLAHSRVGRVLVSIRQNEALAESLGVSCWRYKLFAFVASATFAGLAGALYAHYVGFINPTPFGVDSSLNSILALIVGGSGTLIGPFLGAAVVGFLPEYLRIAETYRLIAYGLFLVLATIFMPRGIAAVIEALRARFAGPPPSRA
jgi:branched-chain amino acid transport system permease protein